MNGKDLDDPLVIDIENEPIWEEDHHLAIILWPGMLNVGMHFPSNMYLTSQFPLLISCVCS